MKRSSQSRAPRRARNETAGSPERLADALLVRIFRGDYPPGSRLPPERQLAIALGVDRTTLRMALKQLARMNLLVARHGSGIEVRDYRTHGGLDVLAAVFAQAELPLEGSFMVEALDFWLDVFSMMAAKTVVRMSLEDLRTVEKGLDKAIEARGREAAAESLVELTDVIAQLSGSVIFRMLNNSTRSIKLRIIRLLLETVDVGEALQTMKRALRDASVARPPEEMARAALHAQLRAMCAKLREQLLFGDPPRRKDKR